MIQEPAELASIGDKSDPAEGSRAPLCAVTTANPGGTDPGRAVVEVGWGMVAYPPAGADGLWRAVFTEGGRRRYRQAMTEAGLAVKLEKVTERLAAGAPNMERPGADLIGHYLDLDRLPPGRAVVPQARAHPAQAVSAVRRPGHRSHHLPGHHARAHAADRQRRADRQRGRPAAPLPVRPGDRGHQGRVPDSPRLREVHWQAAGRPLPDPRAAAAGESALLVDPAEIPPPATSPRSAMPWPAAGAADWMS